MGIFRILASPLTRMEGEISHCTTPRVSSNDGPESPIATKVKWYSACSSFGIRGCNKNSAAKVQDGSQRASQNSIDGTAFHVWRWLAFVRPLNLPSVPVCGLRPRLGVDSVN